jgi:hypothetical protein
MFMCNTDNCKRCEKSGPIAKNGAKTLNMSQIRKRGKKGNMDYAEKDVRGSTRKYTDGRGKTRIDTGKSLSPRRQGAKVEFFQGFCQIVSLKHGYGFFTGGRTPTVPDPPVTEEAPGTKSW